MMKILTIIEGLLEIFKGISSWVIGKKETEKLNRAEEQGMAKNAAESLKEANINEMLVKKAIIDMENKQENPKVKDKWQRD